MADADGFCVVKGKLASRFRQQSKQTTRSKLTIKEDYNFNLQSFKKRLDNCIQEISVTPFFSSSIEKIKSSMSLISQKTTSSYSQESVGVVIQDSSHATSPTGSVTGLGTKAQAPTPTLDHTCGSVEQSSTWGKTIIHLEQDNHPPGARQSSTWGKTIIHLGQCNHPPGARQSSTWGADVQTFDSSCLTCTTSKTCHQHHPVPKVGQTNSMDLSTLTSVEPLSLSSDGEGIHILSYGIGSFATCLVAKYQLAFLLAVRNAFQAKCTECYVYDPVFSQQEKLLLEWYHCQVISENEEGKWECTKPTLAFLPHCGKALYNNLLWRNLATHNSEGLSRLVLIGNSFSNMIERTPARVLNKTGKYLLQLSPHITEVHLDNSFTHKDIFNDLSIHYFLGSQLTAALVCVGPHYDEPVYEEDDAEIICK